MSAAGRHLAWRASLRSASNPSRVTTYRAVSTVFLGLSGLQGRKLASLEDCLGTASSIAMTAEVAVSPCMASALEIRLESDSPRAKPGCAEGCREDYGQETTDTPRPLGLPRPTP